jgi:hypothetical protein
LQSFDRGLRARDVCEDILGSSQTEAFRHLPAEAFGIRCGPWADACAARAPSSETTTAVICI